MRISRHPAAPRRITVIVTAGSISLLLFAGMAPAAASPSPAPSQPVGSRTRHQVVELARGLNYPWSIAFLPDGRALIAERKAGLRVLEGDVLALQRVAGVPEVFHGGEAGYLGLAIDPQFSSNQQIYLCVSLGTAAANHTSVIRVRLVRSRFEESRVIFTAQPAKDRDQHFGCRLTFAPDGTLLATIGDGYHFRDQAQALDSHLGKVIRIRSDGALPPDNPFRGRNGALGEIYTRGHRNAQGLAVRPGTAEIWLHEHGARGGDEVNVLRPGADYGWPSVTFGIDYSGEQIAAAPRAPGIQAPRFYWLPSIAPSGMTFYDGRLFPEWRGDLFVGALAGRALYRLDIEGPRVVGQEILLAELKERIRDVQQGPDGHLYVLTDAADGKVLRIEPAPARSVSN